MATSGSSRWFTTAVCLIACGAFCPWIYAVAQTWDQMIVPYEVPSSSGIATLLKQYIPSGPWYYRLSAGMDAQATNPAPVQLLTGSTPGGLLGADGLVAGWKGDRHLTIGTPIGQPVMYGLSQSGPIEISYIAYEPDLTKTAGQLINHIILRNVEYTVQETENIHHDVDCTIRIRGIDQTFFDAVVVDIVGHGAGQKRIEETVGGGTVSLKFSLDRLPGVQSTQLTPTQAILGDISLIVYPTAIRGPLQERMSLRYAALDFPQVSKIFEMLRDGSYNIRFNLTFGEQEIVYSVPNPITASAAAAYQKCEARTNIFSRLLGESLFHS